MKKQKKIISTTLQMALRTKLDLDEDLKTTCSCVFQSIVDFWHEMQRLTKQHAEIINKIMFK